MPKIFDEEDFGDGKHPGGKYRGASAKSEACVLWGECGHHFRDRASRRGCDRVGVAQPEHELRKLRFAHDIPELMPRFTDLNQLAEKAGINALGARAQKHPSQCAPRRDPRGLSLFGCA